MTKVDILRLDSVTNNDTTATSTINTNFQALQEAMENTLSRDGTTPNFMDANLDMNSYRIINAGDPENDSDVITKGWFDEYVDDAATASAEATAAAERAAASAQSAEIASAQASVIASTVGDAVQAAYDWATKTDGTVDGTDYSSKYYALQITPIADDITTVSGIAEDVTTVAGISEEITDVANNEDNINAVSDNEDNINTVATNISNVNAVGTDITNVNSVAGDLTNIDEVLDNLTNIDTVAEDITNVNAVGTSIANVNTVATNMSDVTEVATNVTDIMTVATDIESVVAVAGDLDNIDAASGYAQEAKDWANKLGGTVDGTEYSAKKYAQDAAASAASIDVDNIGAALDYTDDTLSLENASGDVLSSVTIQASAASDNLSITKNTSDELQTIGVIDQNDTTTAIKTWTGTKAQYDAITTKDNSTFYTCTDTHEIYLGTVLVADKSSASGNSLLDFKWSDHELDEMSWLRADTFSWRSGSVYSSAYEHLVADIEDKELQSETIGAITIQYYLADDGHKIVPASEESNVASLFTTTGVAWYYILDTDNTRFKLPRTKYGFVGLKDTVGNYVPESLPNIAGDFTIGYSNPLTSTGTGAFYNKNSGSCGRNGSNTITDNYVTGFDASLSSSSYQDNAPVQQRSTQMYLYFYVGEYAQSAIEQTAGITAEELNSKVDIDDLVAVPIMVSRTANTNGGVTEIWSDGYCVQTGKVTRTATGTVSITLDQEYKDTTYTVQATNLASDTYTTASTFYNPYVLSVTTTGFSLSSNAAIASIDRFVWEAKGYIE